MEALHTYSGTARLRYDNGYTSYIEVLDAERSLFDAKLGLTQTKGGLFQALINLYKAMGGGWGRRWLRNRRDRSCGWITA